jgi:hypothetical protein
MLGCSVALYSFLPLRHINRLPFDVHRVYIPTIPELGNALVSKNILIRNTSSKVKNFRPVIYGSNMTHSAQKCDYVHADWIDSGLQSTGEVQQVRAKSDTIKGSNNLCCSDYVEGSRFAKIGDGYSGSCIHDFHAFHPFGAVVKFQGIGRKANVYASAFLIHHVTSLFMQLPRLPANYTPSQSSYNDQPPIGPFEGCVPLWRVGTGFGLICLAAGLFIVAVRRENGWLALLCGLLVLVGSFIWLTGHYWGDCYQQTEYRQTFQHDGENVSQKLVGFSVKWNYASVKAMIPHEKHTEMDVHWHTRVTVACITTVAVMEAANEALPHLPNLANMLPAWEWVHLIPLLLLIVAGVSWLWGRSRPRSGLQAHPQPTIETPSKLVIHSATYRGIQDNNQVYEVTEFLRAIISGNGLVFDIENHNFVIGGRNFVPKDPLPFKAKRLLVKYSYAGQLRNIERYEHDRLVLPEDSQIARLEADVQRLRSENKQFARTASVNISLMSENAEFSETADCPLKVRFHLRNDSVGPIDVQYQDYRPELITIKKGVTEIFQVRLAGSWLPEPDGLARIAVYPGQQLRGWIAADEGKFTKDQVDQHRGKIGTLILRVNEQDIEIKL